MKFYTTNVLLVILGIILILCFILMIMNNDNNNIETFDPVVDAIQLQLQNQNPDQLKSTIKTLQQRLIDYGYAPDLNSYVKKTELGIDSGKCTVSTAVDRDKYMSKSDAPTVGPRIDLSQYVKKSSIPPEKVCPNPPEIDYSAYVKKSTLPPNEKCPPCIAPKVKVSAGLCRDCPPAPSCPPPERCPDVQCPPQIPCPAPSCRPCDEIRYIKVPTVITKTVMVDINGNILSQQTNVPGPNQDMNTSNQDITETNEYEPNQYQPTTTQYNPSSTQYQPSTTQYQPSIQQCQDVTTTTQYQQCVTQNIPTTSFPTFSMTLPNTTLAQTLLNNAPLCPSADLNSEFKSYGIYGPTC